MHDMLIGLAFVFVIEGVIYALFPAGARRMALEVQKISDSSLRIAGISAVAIGVLGVWLLRG
jgi:uncharacterized protein YjeT (DUF2065 family)